MSKNLNLQKDIKKEKKTLMQTAKCFSDSIEDLVIKRNDYISFCDQTYRCMMGFNSCSSSGYIRVNTLGECSLPTVEQCLDQTQQNCFENSACVKEVMLEPISSTNLSCQKPQKEPSGCEDNCQNNSICNLYGYYYQIQTPTPSHACAQLDIDNRQNCLGKPLCGESYIDSICRSFGFINDENNNCRNLVASDCLQPENINYCKGPESFCIKQFGFTYDSNSQTCNFNCLQNYNCKDGSFCLLDAFGYSKLNSLGKCYISLSVNDCINYKSPNVCPIACKSQYKLLVTSQGCGFPPHSYCENATELTQYGCSTDKQVCVAMGWTQVTKGSNKCQDPTNICMSQFSLCNAKDSQTDAFGQYVHTSLGNYLGLIKNNSIGWIVPTIDQCLGQQICYRPQNFCRKAGFNLSPYQICSEPDMIKDCLGQQKCSSKFVTICQKKYGFSNPQINQQSKCIIPNNCNQLKKLSINSHVCELGGFISLDNSKAFVDSQEIYNYLDININLNYKIILNYCIDQIEKKLPICQSGTSVCNLIGFLTNPDGTCSYPQVEACLTSGSGKCSSNNICLRYYKLQQSETSNDCTLPYGGDFLKCQYLFESQKNIYHYCISYFGYSQQVASDYCKSQDNSYYCNNTFKGQYCDIFNQKSNCSYKNYTQFNSYIQYQSISINNPLDYIFNICAKNESDPCTQLGFINKKLPQTCGFRNDTYNHACHMSRRMNPIDLANLCLGKPSCSDLCIFYGFISGTDPDKSCQIPKADICSNLEKTVDIFYHACAFLNYQTSKMYISQYCLQKQMCSSQDSICIKYYNFASSPDGSGNCQIPDYQNCLNLNEFIPINCLVMFEFLLKPVNALLISLQLEEYKNLKSNQKGLVLELGLLITSDNLVKEPQPFDCLQKPLCTTPTRFGNISPPYQTYCIAKGFSQNQDGKSCFLDVKTCVQNTKLCSEACTFSGFAQNAYNNTTSPYACKIMDKDQFYCDPTYKVKSSYCDSLGYKWVNGHYEYPTHAECEDNSNGFCGYGKISCTLRGWTSVNGKCQYKINCLDKGNNYCQNNISICFYLGYVQSLSYYNFQYNYDCVLPSNLNCSQEGAKNCASKNYSICAQQGFIQGNNSECKCPGVVYQGVCFLINNINNQGNTSIDSSVLQFNICNLLIIFLIFLANLK
ncbi:hypothetical protein ABPG72_014982 [Tetrahymena utriculariae]